MAQADTERGGIGQAVEYFTESWKELKKVHFPSRQETVQITIVVIGMIAFFGFFLGVADFLFGRLMQMFLS